MTIADRLEKLKLAIFEACERAGRNVAEVQLVAVSKTKPWENILEAILAQHFIFGENYVQEALEKIKKFREWGMEKSAGSTAFPKIKWHFIGHLQSNKARSVVGTFDLIHSLDRMSLAKSLNSEASRINVEIPVLVQVNVDNEISKSGLSVSEVPEFLKQCNSLNGISIQGFMCIPDPDKPDSRAAFARLRELRDTCNANFYYRSPLRELSMGMSADYKEAILEGSTIIRVGTAIFGER